MSVSLATTNPEAAARIGTELDMPEVGMWVIYHYRPGEIIAGMAKAPALVLARDPENAVLRLLVIRDRDDILKEDRVPRRRPNERGWDYIPDDSSDAKAMARADDAHDRLQAFMDELSAVFFGDQPKPDQALLDQFEEMKLRLEKLEKLAQKRRNPSEV